MPRYIVERSFSERVKITVNDEGAEICRIVMINGEDGVTWIRSYISEDGMKSFCSVNGGRANIKLGQRDYLIQQNWVNDRNGHCALNSSL
jgi:hypothetical protein